MTPTPILEERLARIERQMEELRRRLDRMAAPDNWLAQIAGSLKDEPEFDEVLRLGKAIRQADNPSDPA